MSRITSLTLALLLIGLFMSRQSYAVLERFNVGVGYGGADELAISTDSPGEFNYRLYLRTANNTESWIKVHYAGINNLHRTIRLNCATDELDAVDNPANGTCISGGPFVRGAFVAGNDNQYAVVKLFTLFCGSIQVEKEVATNNWNSDFDNNTVEEFLDNGASSTWCPASSPTATPTPTLKKIIAPTKKPTATPKITRAPTKTLTSVKKIPTPTAMQTALTVVTASPVPTVSRSENIVTESENNNLMWIALGSGLLVCILAGVGFLKRNSIKTFLGSLSTSNADTLTELPNSTNAEIGQDESIHS